MLKIYVVINAIKKHNFNDENNFKIFKKQNN